MTISRFGVTVIGGGPAGIAAAIAASVDGASVLLIERGARLGGMLKQCIHDGFGSERYGEQLTGPEYAFKDISTLQETNVVVMLQTTILDIFSNDNIIQMNLCNRHGTVIAETKSVILATGSREKTAIQTNIHGTKPTGVMTAGTAQYYLNVMGQLPVQRCIILGSDDAALITARRLTIEGAKVAGVYEPSDKPAGQLKNVSQCLFEYEIPLELGHTVTRTFGSQRLRAVELCRVDKAGVPIRGSEKIEKCDGLILSTGLIPENEIAEKLGVPISKDTNGPICDQNNMTLIGGVFTCGNAMNVFDKVEYVSQSGENAGRSASRYMPQERRVIEITAGKEILTLVPQYIDYDILFGDTVMYFRCASERRDATVRVLVDGREVFAQKYEILRPAVTEKIVVNLAAGLTAESNITLRIE
ncbi:MAG: FAD-dependent oxidoreductase [Oscillospiraceae bacterium]|nr:FAD-dependent oxidoreductase [Oscillospiraceae bacterium]